MGRLPLFARGLLAALVVLVLDQATKWWIVAVVMQPPRIIEVTPFFNLVMGWNTGVSFGIMTESNAIFLSLVALAVVAGLLVWLKKADRVLIALAIGLIIGGALGNVIDRLHYGAVADFLDFHLGGAHWPAFNVADSGITVGAAILLFDSLFGKDETTNNKNDAQGTGTGA